MLELMEKYQGEKKDDLDVINTIKSKYERKYAICTGDERDKARKELVALKKGEDFLKQYGCGVVCYPGKYVTLVVTVQPVTGQISGEYRPCTHMRDYIMPTFHNNEYNVNSWFDCICRNMLIPVHDCLPNINNLTLDDVRSLDVIFNEPAVAKTIACIDDYIYATFITNRGDWYED